MWKYGPFGGDDWLSTFFHSCWHPQKKSKSPNKLQPPNIFAKTHTQITQNYTNTMKTTHFLSLTTCLILSTFIACKKDDYCKNVRHTIAPKQQQFGTRRALFYRIYPKIHFTAHRQQRRQQPILCRLRRRKQREKISR